MDFATGAGLALGVVGTLLGVLSWWRDRSRDRVRLLVIPFPLTHLSDTETRLAVEVVNLSEFSVSVSGVSFQWEGDGTLMLALWKNSPPVPARLESRQSVTFVFEVGIDAPVTKQIRFAVAETACRHRARSSAGAFDWHRSVRS